MVGTAFSLPLHSSRAIKSETLSPRERVFHEAKEAYADLADGLSRELGEAPRKSTELLKELKSLAENLTPENYSALRRSLRSAVYGLEDELRPQNEDRESPEVERAAKDLDRLVNLAQDFTYGRLGKALSSFPERRYLNRPPITEIANFDLVSPFLLRGGNPTQEGFEWLVSGGVRTFVELMSEDSDEPELSRWENVKTYDIPVDNYCLATFEQVEEFLKILRDSANLPVYVHCKAGQGRTGLMVGCWRITQGWSAEQAYEELLSYDPHKVDPEQEKRHREDLKDFLHSFESYWAEKTT